MGQDTDNQRYLQISASQAMSVLSGAGLLTTPTATSAALSGKGQIQTDSRKIQPGDIFIAYRGVASDGHAYLETAAKQGASLLVVEDPTRAYGLKTPIAAVRNGREAWAWLAAAAAGNPQDKLTFLGVTGTNGKTSTSWIAAHLLEGMDVPTLLVGTTGAKLGSRTFPTRHTTPDPCDFYPLLAQALELGARVVAMEVSSHAIRQKKLAPVGFSCAAFTSFSRDHLDFHPDMQDYWNAKWELFTEKLRADGLAVVCDKVVPPSAEKRPSNAPVIVYGRTGKSGFVSTATSAVIREKASDFTGSDIAIDRSSSTVDGRIPYFGGHAVENFVAANLCVEQLTGRSCPPALWRTVPDIPGRLERVVTDKPAPMVIVDYAHTPDALEKTLALLRPLTTGDLICVFGCGGDRDPGKRPEMGKIAEKYASKVYITSDNPRSEDPQDILNDIRAGLTTPENAVMEVDRAKAIAQAIAGSTASDIVCVAGKGHETYQILGSQTIAFDDRMVAAECLRKWKQ